MGWKVGCMSRSFKGGLEIMPKVPHRKPREWRVRTAGRGISSCGKLSIKRWAPQGSGSYSRLTVKKRGAVCILDCGGANEAALLKLY
jgi:hypothetical protein